MIIASFDYLYVTAGGGQDTGQYLTVDLDFTALYQINPRHLIVLKYVSISALRKDATNGTLQPSEVQSRLIGNFNETRNIVATIPGGPPGQTIAAFDGITFNSYSPFRAPKGARLLMPPTFQIEFRSGAQSQVTIGDDIRVWISIGYDLELKETRF